MGMGLGGSGGLAVSGSTGFSNVGFDPAAGFTPVSSAVPSSFAHEHGGQAEQFQGGQVAPGHGGKPNLASSQALSLRRSLSLSLSYKRSQCHTP